MSKGNVTSLRIPEPIIQKINEKCPNVNLSMLMRNVLEYILSQDTDLIIEFSKKPSQ